MQSLTNGVYSLLLGGDGEEPTGSKLPPPLQPMATACSGNPGVPTFVVLGPGDGTREGARVALDASDRVMQEAARNRNRRTCVLLKTPMTPPVVEETMSRWLAAERENEVGNYQRRDEEPPSAVVPEIVFTSKIFSRGYNSVVAEAKEEVAHVEVDPPRNVRMNTGRPAILVITSCNTTFKSTAPPRNVAPLPKTAEEGMRALGATLRGVLSTTFSGRELTGTVLGVFHQRSPRHGPGLLRLICWHGPEDAATPGATPVLLYTAVSEAYAQFAAGDRPLRPTWKPRWYTKEEIAFGSPIEVDLNEMAPLDRDAWREKLGVRAWLPPVKGREASEKIIVGMRDEDNLRGLGVGVAHDRLFFR